MGCVWYVLLCVVYQGVCSYVLCVVWYVVMCCVWCEVCAYVVYSVVCALCWMGCDVVCVVYVVCVVMCLYLMCTGRGKGRARCLPLWVPALFL